MTTEDGDQIPVDTVEGRLWTCEWPGPPLNATVSVDGGTAVAVSFFQRLPRILHHLAEQPQERAAKPGQVLWGWYRSASQKPDQ